jgi:hypothetical protein
MTDIGCGTEPDMGGKREGREGKPWRGSRGKQRHPAGRVRLISDTERLKFKVQGSRFKVDAINLGGAPGSSNHSRGRARLAGPHESVRIGIMRGQLSTGEGQGPAQRRRVTGKD